LQRPAKDWINVALDDMDEDEACSLAGKLKGLVWGFKVNALYSTNPNIVVWLKESSRERSGGSSKRGKVFVDMKIHDIPRSAANHAIAQIGHGADMINCHASGGAEMMRKIRKAVKERNKNCLVVAVTVLTSLDRKDCKEIYGSVDIDTEVINLATLALEEAHLDGIVCSPNEVGIIKRIWGDHVIAITPGIRLAGDDPEDQKRLDTPYNAIINGSDMLVVGSSITKADDPVEAVKRITNEIEMAQSYLSNSNK